MNNQFAFVGGAHGAWRVQSIKAVRGAALPSVPALDVAPLLTARETGGGWLLRGVVSNLRYAVRGEVESLRARQEGLGREQARCAALIPVRKSDAWWALAQDERRAVFEERSGHTAIGLDYLPAIARQLYHSRDLGEPFDFLTWFEYAPRDASLFEELVARLRATPEWTFVEREIDIRLQRM